MSTGVQLAASPDPQKSSIALSQLDEAILALIMAQTPLREILDALCVEIEKQHSGLLCSVLLLERDGTTLRSSAAPSLPQEYSQAIDGFQAGPRAGSCGTAVYRKQQVVVSDIANDPLWAHFKQLAMRHGLRACWSTPIASPNGKILGTFAIYYREPRTPDDQHLQVIAHATQLAGIAIERDRAKAELRAVESRYRTLVERLPAITYVAELGAEGPWHYVSPQIESILGFSPAEWLADPMNWLECIQSEDRHIALAAEKRFQETHELFQAEYRMIARDGRVLWFRDEAVMLRDTNSQSLLMQGVLYDITERKRLEDQLRHSQKMEAVGQLAGGVAHDFNNLLMLIQAHNERLRERLVANDPAHKDALEIEHAVTRAASLTRQLLAFSRKQVLQPKVLDLNAVLSEVATMLDRLIGKNIELNVAPARSLWRVKADPGQMEQVILNLAVNARDAMPQGGKLVIETRNVQLDEAYARNHEGISPGRYVRLTISDTGIGMDAETQARMFEPFFTTKEPGKGTGLGLATVYGVVKQTGGCIWVSSEPGRGTTFEIYLPQIEEIERAATVSSKKTMLSNVPKGTETVLLVEDQDGIRDLVGQFLRRNGYTVLHAVDGDEALRIAAGHGEMIDLLLTDVLMPNIGGRELAERLIQVRPQMRVLFMSGYPEHTSLGGETMGQPAAVLQKPFSMDNLARKIRNVLDVGDSRE
jgi:two-component system, cell cycle sensor histidine kinase and response regulator CckA